MDIVYTINTEGAGAVFAERAAAEESAQVWSALRESKTWGEFKAAMPPAEFATVLENMKLDDDEVDLESAFDPDEVPGHADGLFPTCLQAKALRWFPEELIARYGEAALSTHDGEFLDLPANIADEVAEALRLARPEWTVTRTDLYFR